MAKILKVIVPCAAILLAGVVAMMTLASFERPPAKVKPQERALPVEAVEVQPEDVPAVVTGYGPVRSLNVVAIMPEVAGTVVEIHARLEVGEVIPKGEILFVIDPRTYQARVDDAAATVAQLGKSVERLQIQRQTDQERLGTLERTRDLARAEYERQAALFTGDQVGTQAGVDRAEQAYNVAQDQVDRMAQALALYPIQVEEARGGLAAAEARLAQSKINLERTRVVAPFDARVKSHRLEKGQYVAPGAAILTLADDSVLEVSVPLDSREARRWLAFNGNRPAGNTAWFSEVDRVECKIRWTEEENHSWVGRLDRVEKFDEQTRTITVAVRVDAGDGRSGDPGGLPLVEGMFCEVAIPGGVMKGVYRLPRSAVSFDGTVYVAKDNRLRTVPVELLHERDNEAFVSSGLAPGDLVLTTRLVNPLENALLEVTVVDAEEAEEAGS